MSIEKQKLIEKHAEKLGVPNVTAKWMSFSNGGAQQDALLSGGVDIINTGTGPLLVLWDKTRGKVKGIVASSAQPLQLISRDPRIKSLKDLQAATRSPCPPCASRRKPSFSRWRQASSMAGQVEPFRSHDRPTRPSRCIRRHEECRT